MSSLTDVLGRTINIGDHVGCAFSYSQASVGHIRLGVLEEAWEQVHKYNPNMAEVMVKVRWDEDNKLSPKMSYAAPTRWILL